MIKYKYVGTERELKALGYEFETPREIKGYHIKTIQNKNNKEKLSILIDLNNNITFIGNMELKEYLLKEIKYEVVEQYV